MLAVAAELNRTSRAIVSRAEPHVCAPIDANGNLTFDGTRTFSWNAADLMVALQASDARTELSYDGKRHWIGADRFQSEVLSASSRYIWNAGVPNEERTATGTTARFHFKAGVISGTAASMFALDHLNSVRAITDIAANLVATVAVEPYGASEVLTGSWAEPRRVLGLFYDHGDHGVLRAEFRPFHSESGRWIAEDPLGLLASTNLYDYVLNNPIFQVDETGLAPWYGNYCGPGNSPGDPIDDIDSTCRDHDECYRRLGVGGLEGYLEWFRNRCELLRCDQEMCNSLARSRVRTLKGIRAAGVMSFLFCNRRRLPPPKIPVIH